MSNKSEILGAIGFIAIVGFLALTVFSVVTPWGYYDTVNAGERGVVKYFGEVQSDVLDEGFHWKMPIRTRIIKMDVKTLKYEIGANAASKDMQKTSTTIAVNYRLSPSNSNDMYQSVGTKYEDVLIAPAVQEAVKSTTAEFEASDLLAKRLFYHTLMIHGKRRSDIIECFAGTLAVCV